MLLYIVIGILLFGLLIAVHEGGHFLTAKMLDVRVNEFSIGMGPAFFSRQKGETKYSLRAFPIGGYCALEGEDEETGDPRSFVSKPLWKKILILAAGSVCNYIAGVLIIVLVFAAAGSYVAPVIDGFMEGFPCAGENGLLPGDRILSIDGHKICVYNDVSYYLNAEKRDTYDLTVRRDGKRVALNNLPLSLREYQQNGETVQRYGIYFAVEKATPANLLRHSWNTGLYFARCVWQGLGMMVTGQAGLRDLSGPVGIVSYMGEAGTQSETVKEGLLSVCYFVALIAINLAIMNMLPIPALDGGRIFLLIVGKLWFILTKRALNPKLELYLNAGFFVLLMAFMLLITCSDMAKILFDGM